MNCVICEKQNSPQFQELKLLEDSDLIISHFPVEDGVQPTQGHLILEPNTHLEDIDQLKTESIQGMGIFLATAVKAIKKTFQAEHVYLFRINDKVSHLHYHFVPRYAGTPKEFYGPGIMKYTQAMKITPEKLQELKNNFVKIYKELK